ncbi:MAG: hypothetical protein JSV22_02235 [Bacteroidales bacterium]|nr:MAG: hypothetical protein JSV22_02235 [Bacteroidales bacterium]
MNKTIICLSLVCSFLSFISCKESRQESSEYIETEKFVSDSLAKNLIADTIIYEVIIKNPNPDDKWTEKCLEGFDKNSFVDQLFNAVYDKQATAYDFFTGSEITPRGLKKIERSKDFSREKIGKIQFSESWYYDSLNIKMEKRIISMVLGYELHGDDGEIIGYKPVFKINMDKVNN